jgi:hypothetical protein
MQYIEGNIISGEFDKTINVFTLQKVKNLFTETTLKEKQVEDLYGYLKKHQNEDGQIISLYDQLLVRLSQDELKILLTDLEIIKSMYH